MSEEDIIRFCAPTLAGIKTGSLFASMFSGKPELFREVRNLNRRLAAKGIRVVPLSFRKNRALLYFYRTGMLKETLCHSLASNLLAQRGYPCGSAGRERIPADV